MKYHFSPHVAIQVNQYQSALVFLEKILGFEMIESGPRESQLKAGMMHFYVEATELPLPSGRQTFFEFTTPVLEQAHQELESAGCKLEQSQTPEGQKSYLVQTPYGFSFHLFQG